MEDKPRVSAELVKLLSHRPLLWWLSHVVMLGVVTLVVLHPLHNGLLLGLACVIGILTSAVLLVRCRP